MAGHGTYALLCRCGANVEFDDAMRGEIVSCVCDRRYRVPLRAGALTRLWGKLRWAHRWWSAGDRRAPAPPSVEPYREAARRTRCPQCRATPAPDALWQCEFCQCQFDTFAVRAKCPRCGFQFPATMCLACRATSRHADWYDAPP